ncbi:MAG: hypothetical protein NTV55_12820, partial [Planctomycetota bacterium]|nr:hypothetical protein [Planctomycetota bacterium]
IRPAVLIRKNSYGNGSERGAQTQAVMMTIMRTLKMRGHNPVQTLVDVLNILCPLRKTSAFADKNHGKRLKGYKKRMARRTATA